MQGNFFVIMQRLGKALMLPIAVLPVAGLLLRLGQPDVFNIVFVMKAGQTLFENLPLLFAIGISGGGAKDNHCAASLAGTIGYLVLTSVMQAINPELNMGVLSGILTGLLAGVLYNRYHNIKLPEYLAFFGGKRFVPIATGLSCLLLGVILGWAWTPVQHGVNAIGNWLVASGPVGPFVYGILNVLFRVVGLHHIVNSLVWFVFGSFTAADGTVVTGDIHRFFAGDPSAGAFMAGYFPVFMFALPAACLAMYHAAPKDKRPAVAGLFLSLALTTFLTGITEPVEYTFLFLSPVLYGIHAVLTGVSMAVCQILGIKLGFTFSAGLIDYVLSFGLASHPLLMLPIGGLWALIYYFLFRFFISRFNLATPGREDNEETISAIAGSSDLATAYLAALGGKENIMRIDACITRLRLEVANMDMIQEPELRKLGAMGVVKRGDTGLQVIVGTRAEIIAGEISELVNQQGGAQ
ncbi:PTS N-acetyl-D-glucosamine transporter [Escherichia coli]|uniref:N-acetylglucosamine-specific PTS transporter subunit IIBC n=1 Tax=Escherichia coli TaxID=562 RepID=UPI000EF8752E|nr:N-acetylglucosamine-specific PTS transporter subunit IIBC [Escherichia coli]RLX71994.1 PTS N-acetyl-D-glucosamine transporter [Escherichia coli]